MGYIIISFQCSLFSSPLTHSLLPMLWSPHETVLRASTIYLTTRASLCAMQLCRVKPLVPLQGNVRLYEATSSRDMEAPWLRGRLGIRPAWCVRLASSGSLKTARDSLHESVSRQRSCLRVLTRGFSRFA